VFPYKIYISRNHQNNSSLVLPKSLQLLPLCVVGLLKSTAFTPGLSFSERSYQIYSIERMSFQELVNFAAPKFWGVTDVLLNPGEIIPYRLLDEHLKSDRIFILNSWFNTFIYIGKSIPEQLCFSLFNVKNPKQKNQEDYIPYLKEIFVFC
jgi:hypothetical protein